MTETKLMMPVSPRQLSHAQLQRAVAALLGAAIGDALGAPFEFGPAGKYLEAFPEPVLTGTGEMTGGGAFDWAPGEFTDDTQMAVALAESLVACAGGSVGDYKDSAFDVVQGRILATSPRLHLPLKQELACVSPLPPKLYGA